MDRTANLPQKPRGFRTFAALFVILLALPAAYADQNSASPEPAKLASTSAPVMSTRPFSKLAIGVTAGTLGVGAELVTPLSRRTNLRVDSHFFNYAQTVDQDGISYNANLRLRDFRASYDIFPFGGGFRLSGGVAMYNQFNVKALATVPSNKAITLNDVDYFSSPTNPLRGNATVAYGNKVAPTVTFGWGNAIPRSGRHLAFPVEIGAAFTGTPKFDLAIDPSSSACDAQGNCQPVANFSAFNTDKAAQIKKINNDIEPFRFYPIINFGVTYRF
jgi:hypothetical protein